MPSSDTTQEVWSVTINNPVVGGSYTTTIGQTSNVTGAISMFASAATFRNAFSAYYYTYFSSTIAVTLVMYDIAGVVTIVNANSVKNVYTVTIYRLINQKSFASLSFAHTTAATFALTIQQSSAPIGGTFTL